MSSENQPFENKPPENKPGESMLSENSSASEVNISEKKSSEINLSENHAPEIKLPENSSPEIKSPENKSGETKLPEKISPETKLPAISIPESTDNKCSKNKKSKVIRPKVECPICHKEFSKNGYIHHWRMHQDRGHTAEVKGMEGKSSYSTLADLGIQISKKKISGSPAKKEKTEQESAKKEKKAEFSTPAGPPTDPLKILRLDPADKCEILDFYYANGKNKHKTARWVKHTYGRNTFGTKNIRYWLKHEQRLRTEAKFRKQANDDVKDGKYPHMEAILAKRIRELRSNGVTVLTWMIVEEGKKAFDEIYSDEKVSFKFSASWLRSFLKRYNFSKKKTSTDDGNGEPDQSCEEVVEIDPVVPSEADGGDEEGLGDRGEADPRDMSRRLHDPRMTAARKCEILDYYYTHGENKTHTALWVQQTFGRARFKTNNIRYWLKQEDGLRSKAGMPPPKRPPAQSNADGSSQDNQESSEYPTMDVPAAHSIPVKRSRGPRLHAEHKCQILDYYHSHGQRNKRLTARWVMRTFGKTTFSTKNLRYWLRQEESLRSLAKCRRQVKRIRCCGVGKRNQLCKYGRCKICCLKLYNDCEAHAKIKARGEAVVEAGGVSKEVVVGGLSEDATKVDTGGVSEAVCRAVAGEDAAVVETAAGSEMKLPEDEKLLMVKLV